MQNPEKIAVVGLGYIGLPLALALIGLDDHDVVGFDIDRARVDQLNAGVDRNEEVVQQALSRLAGRCSADPQVLGDRTMIMVAVPTGLGGEGAPDISPVLEATRTIAEVMGKGTLVVYESTLPIGTLRGQCLPLLESASGGDAGHDFHLAYAPERLNPGEPGRQVVGISKFVFAADDASWTRLEPLYRALSGEPVLRVREPETAEFAKLLENAQRDLNVAFVNDMARLADSLGLSIHDVLALCRSKWNFLDFKPGLVGGPCIPASSRFLLAAEQSADAARLLSGARAVNEQALAALETWVGRQAGGNPLRLLQLGAAYKAGVRDLRGSGALALARRLRTGHPNMRLHDPAVSAASAPEGLEGLVLDDPTPDAPFDAVLFAVGHHDYLELEAGSVERLLDARGIVLDPWRLRPDLRARFQDRYRTL